ncbi:hypothetical protein BKP42_54920 [Rhodococcus erythropolis]|nr:hypothetical protein BKP42_54920 [Rhodococcus erythropolis]
MDKTMDHRPARPLMRATTTCVGVGAAAIINACATSPSSLSPAWSAAPDEHHNAISGTLAAHGCDEVSQHLVAAQIQRASNFDSSAVTPAGARGPAQIMPSLFEKYRAQLGGTAPSGDRRPGSSDSRRVCPNSSDSQQSVSSSVYDLAARVTVATIPPCATVVDSVW